MSVPVEEKYIQRTEKALNARFPDSYRQCISEVNGFVTADGWQVLPIFETSSREAMQRTCDDVTRHSEIARQNPSFPEGGVVVGRKASGELLMLLPDPTTGQLGPAAFAWSRLTPQPRPVAADFSQLAGATAGR